MQKSNWKIIAASVPGTSHTEKQVPCQDAFICETAGDNLIVAAADGAGSAAQGKVGASTACEFFAQGVRAWLERGSIDGLDKDFGLGFLKILQDDITRRAAHQNISDFACTLLAAVVGTERAAFFQIGDGAIVYGEGDEFRLFTPPQQGEYANSTHFVTDETAQDFLKVEIIERRIDEIAVFTDGLQRIALDFRTGTPHAPFFRPMFAPLRTEKVAPTLEKQLIDFLDSPKINERTDDDKTLILASRK